MFKIIQEIYTAAICGKFRDKNEGITSTKHIVTGFTQFASKTSSLTRKAVRFRCRFYCINNKRSKVHDRSMNFSLPPWAYTITTCFFLNNILYPVTSYVWKPRCTLTIWDSSLPPPFEGFTLSIVVQCNVLTSVDMNATGSRPI